MIKDLNTDKLNMTTVKSSIVEQLNLISYTSLKYVKNLKTISETDLENWVDSDSLVEFNRAIKTEGKQSYVYIISFMNQVKYVGKAIDVKARLRSHLIYKSASTNSKIKKIYDIVKDNNETTIQIFAFKIPGNRLYSMVEGFLIDHFDTTNIGWNESES